MIRLAVMDDHPVVWRAIQSLAQGEPDLSYAGHGQSARELLGLLGDAAPDILLLDLRLAELDGFDLLGVALDVAPALRVIIFTGYGSSAMVARAMNGGARGYVLKDSDLPTVLTAVRHVARGGTYVDPRLHATAVDPVRRAGRDALTGRETEVLRLIVDGATDREIAERLHISRHTVKYHSENIKGKLGAHRRTDLVRMAAELMLV